MDKRFFGQSLPRNEDSKLLQGKGLYVDDVHLPNMLHVAFFRSPVAHACIEKIDAEKAKAMVGVHGVYCAEDLGAFWREGILVVPPAPIDGIEFHQRTQGPLAKDKVRHVGEPICAVLAESRYIAEDAVACIEVAFNELPPVVDLKAALEPSAALVHEGLESNLAAHAIQTKGDYESVRDEAALVLEREFVYDRGVAGAMENRGVVAQWDAGSDQLTIWDSTQAPIPVRSILAQYLGLSESQVNVIAPFIGGGFGPKIMLLYPEEQIVPWLAMRMNRPVKWIEDRKENFYATNQERLQIHKAEILFDQSGRILGVKDVFLQDTGAYNPYGLTVPINSQCTLLGPYDIQHYTSEFKSVFTNTTTVSPVRGAGRQHGVFVIERLLDFAAKRLGIDRLEIRRRNFIRPDQFPYENRLIYQDFEPLTYDNGNYATALEDVRRRVGYDLFYEKQQAERKALGRHVGIGVAAYVEGSGIGPYEGARVTVEPSGHVNVATGIGTQGQSHFTVFAQVVAEQLGTPLENVRVTTGDTRRFHWGTGTFASRGAVVAGNACHTAACAVRKKAIELVCKLWESPEADIVLEDGYIFSSKNASQKMSLGELAVMANPMRGAVEGDTEPGLEATRYYGPKMGTTASGVHAAEVEVDLETCSVHVKRYVVVHDCGKVINPMIVDGQIHGGAAMGIGNVLYENLTILENGEWANANFQDYLMPTAPELPTFETGHVETPSPLNPLGVKGAGEAGAIPVGAVIAQAIEDALSEYDLEICAVPITRNTLFELLERCKSTGLPKEKGVSQ
ncbi:MAG: molybdopterin cofactor-binding domain-containing protein [Opitutales bacterium]